MFDSIMNYVEQRELRKFRHFSFDDILENIKLSFPPFPRRYRTPPPSPLSPPLSRHFASISQLIQFHIQRLEYESRQTTFNAKTRLNSANNYFENFNEQKRDNFIKTKKKKDERELNNKFSKFNMKIRGKDFKNKFAHKYG